MWQYVQVWPSSPRKVKPIPQRASTPVPGVDDRAVLERVLGRALGRGDVDRRVVVVGVRGRDGLRPAADGEDEAAAARCGGDEGARAAPAAPRPGPPPGGLPRAGLRRAELLPELRDDGVLGVRRLRRHMPRVCARSARSERSDAVCARARVRVAVRWRPARTWRAAAELAVRVDDRLRGLRRARPGRGRARRSAPVRRGRTASRPGAPRGRTSRHGCRRRSPRGCPSGRRSPRGSAPRSRRRRTDPTGRRCRPCPRRGPSGATSRA